MIDEAPLAVVAFDRLFTEAAQTIRMLGAVTPVGAAEERARLVAAFERGGAEAPRWTYAHVGYDDTRRRLEGALQALAASPGDPLARCYAERAEELLLEARIAEAAGTPRVEPLARARFAHVDADVARAASVLADAWSAASPPPCDAPAVPSDAEDPRSLLSRMRAEVGRRLLPFAVVPHPSLAPLAATGDRTILVATERLLSDEDARRTVLHEIEGHALPRVRARRAPLGVFAFGTARGSDDQEGRALLLEERAGFLTPRRRRQLAARHRTALRMEAGASFVEATRALIADDGFAPREAVLVAERAYRGGDGARAAGLGRERIYLEAFVRVRAALERCPDDEDVMRAGQIAVAWASALRPWAVTC